MNLHVPQCTPAVCWFVGYYPTRQPWCSICVVAGHCKSYLLVSPRFSSSQFAHSTFKHTPDYSLFMRAAIMLWLICRKAPSPLGPSIRWSAMRGFAPSLPLILKPYVWVTDWNPKRGKSHLSALNMQIVHDMFTQYLDKTHWRLCVYQTLHPRDGCWGVGELTAHFCSTDPTVHQSDIWCLTTAAPTFLPILDGGKVMEQYTTALLFAFMPYLRPNPGSLE